LNLDYAPKLPEQSLLSFFEPGFYLEVLFLQYPNIGWPLSNLVLALRLFEMLYLLDVMGNSRRYCSCDSCHILYNQQFNVLPTIK